MSNVEKIALLAECMEVEADELRLEALLEDYDEWDSVTALTFIAMVEEKFKKTLTGQQVKAVRTVAEAIALME